MKRDVLTENQISCDT